MKIDPMDFQIRDGFYSSPSMDDTHGPTSDRSQKSLDMERRPPSLDDFLKILGNPGRYQIVVLILLATNYIPVAVNHLLMAFYAVSTQHHCRPLGKQEFNYNNITIQNVVPIAPPPPPNSQCEMWIDPGNTSKGTQSCINGYEFEFDNNEWTIVAEWGLVCDRKYVGPLVTTIYFTGVMIGGVIFGYLSDRFGRKSVMLLCLYTQCLIGIALHFVRRLVIFMGLRFIQGVFIQGLQSSTYSMVIELFSPQYRTLAGCVVEGFWATGIILLALIAKYVQHWRYIQLAINIPTIATIFYIWIIPESVRWLLSKDKLKKAESIVRSIASYNSLRLDSSWLRNEMETVVRELRRLSPTSPGIKDLLMKPKTRRNSFSLFFIWLSVSLSYYGITYSIPDLSGDIHLNFMIGGGIELAAYLFAFVVFNGFGRKYPLVCYLFVSGLICISIVIIKKFVSPKSVDTQGLSIGLALMGKATVVSSFCGIFIYSSELFPTVLRTVANGSCAFWGRIGSLIAPQLLMLCKYWYPENPQLLTFCAFGGLSFIAAFLTIFLPETYNAALPDTVTEANILGRPTQPSINSSYDITKNKSELYSDVGYGKSPEWVEVDGMIVSRDLNDGGFRDRQEFSTLSSTGDRSSAFSRMTQEVIYETINSSSSPEISPSLRRPLPRPPHPIKEQESKDSILFHRHHGTDIPSSTCSSPSPIGGGNYYTMDPTLTSLGDLSNPDSLEVESNGPYPSRDYETKL
ncbi:solute carrier family 22 member 7 isoform X2 [Lepeophtheirus salmonis]|uniref:Major facilitator superfamily (MFS) profile domain-containing protein n=1 Tax=Lepeophtheirus salmonis TaxID=72036 RepID=A0A0K2U4D8_LEPSM|nr:solute carrier family 22 member 7-like isoform X2 [Lepeophtheirus salmonis]